ncbi:hypothetical protein Tco_0852468 [Tanacetum coccineum]
MNVNPSAENRTRPLSQCHHAQGETSEPMSAHPKAQINGQIGDGVSGITRYGLTMKDGNILSIKEVLMNISLGISQQSVFLSKDRYRSDGNSSGVYGFIRVI